MFPHFSPLSSSSTTNDASNIGSFRRQCDSGNSLICYFCKSCGTRLIHQTVDENGRETEETTVRAGTLKDRNELPWIEAPHIWTRSALVGIPKGVMSYPQQPSEEQTKRIKQMQAMSRELS
jgi:hypothetical protein